MLEKNRIYCMDNVDGMKQLDTESVDLTVTSPPYGNMRDYTGFSWNLEMVTTQLFRCTKVGGVVVWVTNDETIKGSETGNSFKQALSFMSSGFLLHDTMIYQKAGCAMPSRNRYLSSFEYMFVFSKGKPKTYNLIEDRKNRFTTRWGKGRKVRNKDGSWSYRDNYVAKEYGRRYNIWRYANGGQGYGCSDSFGQKHPASFPENLAKDHIISWSNVGDLVLDPFMGGGTTAKMAKKLGRNFIGFEISQEYVDLANARLNSPAEH